MAIRRKKAPKSNTALTTRVHRISSREQWDAMLKKAGNRVVVVQFFQVSSSRPHCIGWHSIPWHNLAARLKPRSTWRPNLLMQEMQFSCKQMRPFFRQFSTNSHYRKAVFVEVEVDEVEVRQG